MEPLRVRLHLNGGFIYFRLLRLRTCACVRHRAAGVRSRKDSAPLRTSPQLLPPEGHRSVLGAAAAAAAPPAAAAAAHAPFSCSSPLLFVRLLFFPLLFFWLGIVLGSDERRPRFQRLLSPTVWHFFGLHFCSGGAFTAPFLILFVFLFFFRTTQFVVFFLPLFIFAAGLRNKLL